MAQEEISFNLVLNGRSIRAEVDATKLHKILEICDMAPSLSLSGGLQIFEIYQIKNEDLNRRLVTASNDQIFISEVPLVLVFCANSSRSAQRFGERSNLFSVQDATIAAAYALGLSTVWVGPFDEEKVSAILNLPKDHRPIAILPIGYANENPKEKTTRSSNDLVQTIM
jgi:FMN reductase [NAD(P)H]